jgi:hypothetical protein
MKARLVPVFFQSGRDEDFDTQVENLASLLENEADILEPVPLGKTLPQADAVVFPQLLGDAYRQLEEIRRIDLPLLVITSEFGTLSMWDWEIIAFLRSEGIETVTPYNVEQTRKLCTILTVKRQLSGSRFLVFQDNPGKGFQAEIFKRFYWWEDRCIELMKEKFGLTIEKRSFQALAESAASIPESETKKVLDHWAIPTTDLSQKALHSAVKLYSAVKREIDNDDTIAGVGINCLNESRFSDTTPCLLWHMLYEEQGLIWGCEADIMSMLTTYLVNKCLDAPVMMTNIYPFLMGMAALKHERISNFPEIVEEPHNHVLLAHCGYFGVVPGSFATEWTLRPPVLEIVDENAHAIDARFPTGEMTMIKLDPTLSKLMVLEGELKGYVQYPGSDCRNGAIVKINDGHRLVNSAYSHHQIIAAGHRLQEIELISKIMNLEIETF